RRHRRLQTRAERSPGELCRQLPARALAAVRASQPLALVLDHPGGDRGQLLELVARGLADRAALLLGEDGSAAAALGPVLDYLIHRAGGQELAAVALVARLGAAPAARGIVAAGRSAGRVGARWARGVARALAQLPLELLHPRLELLDPAVHPQ